MNKRIVAWTLLAAAAIALPPASARADCAADIGKTRETFGNANIAQAGARDSIQRILDLARQKFDDGKKKRCDQLVAKANQLIAEKHRPDCVADIEKTRKSLEMSQISFAGTRDAVQRFLDSARQALKDGKKRRCGKLVTKARQLIAAEGGNN